MSKTEQMQIKAPFTPEQVKGLNEYQIKGHFHNFTCGNPKHPKGTDNVLIATGAGWTCPNCDFTQDWAWNFMADGSMVGDSADVSKIFKPKICPDAAKDKEEE